MERKFKNFIHAISFVSIFFIGFILLFNLIFGKDVGILKILNNVATILAYFVVVINAFFYVRTKRSTIFKILFIIALLLITICYIIALF